MKMKRNLLVFVLPLTFLLSCGEGNGDHRDHDIIIAENNVYSFYEWYLNAIENKNYDDYSPRIEMRTDSSMTLILDQYISNLDRLKFSDNLIDKVKLEFKPCIDNLNQISFEEFAQFDSLDDYERIKCDHGNLFRWFGSMEYPEGIEIVRAEKVSDQEIKISVLLFSDSKEKRHYWDNSITLGLKLIGNDWKIDSFQHEIKNEA